MGNVVNLFSPVTEGVEDVERSFGLLDGKISRKDLAEEAYDTLMDADFKKENATLVSGKAWDIADLYELGVDKINRAKQLHLNSVYVDTLLKKENSKYDGDPEIVEIPCGETKESFLKCKIGNMGRIQNLYLNSIVRDIDCFSGGLDKDITKLVLDMSAIIWKLRDLQ